MRPLIIVMFLLLSVPATACDSYDDCMNHQWIGDEGKLRDDMNNAMTLKAIAYKLDEISQWVSRTDEQKLQGQQFVNFAKQINENSKKEMQKCPRCGSSDVGLGISWESKLYKNHADFKADNQHDTYYSCNKCKTLFIVTTCWNNQKETK